MLSSLEDTISAIITPLGEGGIAVIRLSGKRSFDIASRLFRGRTDLNSAASHTAHVGFIVDEKGDDIDEVVVTVFKAPHSYTTEDCIEISCHGSMYIARKILNACLKAGSRYADPGEFTKRAFLHGRIDLTQAEAVATLIRSQSEASHRASLNQLQGMNTNIFLKIRDEIVNICSLLELDLDFSEEGLSIIETDTCVDKLEHLRIEVKSLIHSYEYGRIIRDGVRVVLTGRPNVGKSSILNALLNQNRSIVTEISGTTRDTIQEHISFEGMQFVLIDSAGIRETSDAIESEGIKRSLAEIKNADVVAYVVDATSYEAQTGLELTRSYLSHIGVKNELLLMIFNKIDLLPNGTTNVEATDSSQSQYVRISAKHGVGISELKKAIYMVATKGINHQQSEGVTITASRHFDSLAVVCDSIEKAIKSIHSGISSEFIVIDLRKALHALDEITGQVTNDDILNRIFDGFCIGK